MRDKVLIKKRKLKKKKSIIQRTRKRLLGIKTKMASLKN